MKNSKFKKLAKKAKFVPKISLNYEVTTLSKTALDTSEQRAVFAQKLFDKKQMNLKEKVVLVLLDSLNFPIGFVNLYTGTSHKVPIDDKEILMHIYKAKADGFYLVHNHPTDSPYPSEADVRHANTLSQKVSFFGDTEYLDDLIITKKGFYSLMDNGLILE